VNATELFDGLSAIPGSKDGGSADGVQQSCVVKGIEFARTPSGGERKLRATWKKRKGGGPDPLLLIADDPEGEGHVRVLGPQPDRPLRRIRAEALFDLVRETVDSGSGRVDTIRRIAEELERLDAEGVPGLVVRDLGTRHLYGSRLPDQQERWKQLTELSEGVPSTGWREALEALGYELTQLPQRGWLAKADSRPVLVIHPKRSAAEFARLDDAGRLPEGTLLAACESQNTPYGMLAAGTRMRLLRTAGDSGGAATSYLELDTDKLEAANRPLLGLLSPTYLAEGGFDDVLREARDYGAELRLRLDRSLREDVLPVLGREMGRWAESDGRDLSDDAVRAELEAAVLTFVFRALFLLYAEGAGYLPMDNRTYVQRSFTRIAERAGEELDSADPRSTSLWRDIGSLVEAMRTGQKAWGVPPYNGDLFAADGFDGAEILEEAAIPDGALVPALVALAREKDHHEVGIDFSGLEIGHLGHIYEGLLSLRLTVADQDFRYEPKRDRYVPDAESPDVHAGELFWLTNEGGRKGGGVYYTRTELVRHLVRRAVRPAFRTHLEEVRKLAEKDPAGAAARLFDFYVIDPACGSAHFLVEVVDELGDQLATLLGDVPMPALREELDSLRAAAGRALGIRVEDTALLKRLALKRCIYGVDLSPMGAEIAKVSLWLGAFVPGLSLAYLDHNIRVGNSLIGVAQPEDVQPPREGGQVALLGEQLKDAIGRASEMAAKLREIDDRTPDVVDISRGVAAALEEETAGAESVLDLWTAEPLGLKGARDEALNHGDQLIRGVKTKLSASAHELVAEQRALHWPLAFPEVFTRDNPGFDVIVGNPPWDKVKVESHAFYALYQPGIRSLPEVERRGAIEQLKRQRPAVAGKLNAERERAEKMREYFRGAGYTAGAGDPDLYKVFCLRYPSLLRLDGYLGVVLPRSTFLNEGSTAFREWLFGEATPERVDFLLNNRRWAFDTHPQYTVALLSARLRRPTEGDQLRIAGVATSVSEFKKQSTDPGIELKRRALGPSWEVPLISRQAEATLLAKLRTGQFFPFGGGRWRCFPVTEFHETSKAKLWRNASEGWPLWKGESFDQFDPNGAQARLCPPSEEALANARKRRPGSGSLLASDVELGERRRAVERTVGSARVAFRDVTNRTNSRTVLACLIPPEHFLTHKAPYLAFVNQDPNAEATCLALMNSLVFDWQARRFVETNVTFFILEGLKLPDLDADSMRALATPAARLSCPDERFAEFARTIGVECDPLEEDERAALRADIDARVARVWGLTTDELEIVFSDFTPDAVPEHYRQAVRDRFAELS
jgi:hypothetical protein